MKYFFSIIISLLFFSADGISQISFDSAYVSRVDSILLSRREVRFYDKDLIQKQKDDTVKFRSVVGRYKNGETIDIAYYSLYGDCESTVFHLFNDELVLIEYIISDPDVHSEGPPSKTYRFYMRNNAIVYQYAFDYSGGPILCKSYSIDDKDFIGEFNACKLFLSKL